MLTNLTETEHHDANFLDPMSLRIFNAYFILYLRET